MYLAKHGIPAEKIVSQAENEVVLEVHIPETCDFFDGHFPEIHLVPAVAQIDMAMHFCNKYFGTRCAMDSSKRLKFTLPVKPETTLHFGFKYSPEKGMISYKLTSSDGLKAYSSGNIAVSK
ncbi:hydroxymyristoyl-ACP dehydratase [Treponema sp.]|uniref:ApeI family dehydratase n=1 Tax=Treponema sp. TaxID=166 RepID=UPI00298E6C5A|nr:hydroxymyristoyl-ACP dehydratase [Treponema sp.]